ncbi:MAG: DUF695 domain-containing protein [Limisphaerales bacterium]
MTKLLSDDIWSLAEGVTDSGPYIIRFRTPVLGPSDTTGYDKLLTIVWPYADVDTGALPTDEQTAALVQFENRLCEAFEHDAHAVLTAILTFDGARQWVVYTSDFRECGRRLEAMPQNEQPYPIELNARSDPEWNYLRDEILKRVQQNA